ncbi:MAG: pentapeptide repeat-containing protein [Halothiobacillaceae bacterium]|nr:MAG: pentapeptide repeat-containing protein [Halothiobacillaceae bacterium]
MARHLWYVRRGEQISGPFPVKLIAQRLLLKRIRFDDEVSVDQATWQTVAQTPELIPSVLQADQHDPRVKERLAAAIRWADDRSGRDRRDRSSPSTAEMVSQRGGRERRQVEDLKEIDHREERVEREEEIRLAERQAEARKRRLQKWQSTSIALLMLVGLGGVLIAIPPATQERVVECSAPPAVKRDWSNCSLPGSDLRRAMLAEATLRNSNLTGSRLNAAVLHHADLSYAELGLVDLRGADLSHATLLGAGLQRSNLTEVNFSGANLAYANLTGAIIKGAQFQQANLDKTIWIDGRICGEGSKGECLVQRSQ